MRAAARPLLSALAVAGLAVTAVASDAPREPDPSAPLLSAWKDGEVVAPRGLPSPWIPPSNPPTDAKIALGRRLFFEKALSKDRSKSCAHCHDPALAFADGRKTAIGVRGQVGRRNVPSLLNAAIAPFLFWDGRSVSLEAQAEGPLLAVDELDMTEDLLVERIREIEAYAPLFAAAFGTPTVTLRRASQAISSFERTLLAADSPFDRWWFGKDDAALDAAQKRGYELFRTKGSCASCHSIRPAEAAFSDFEFHATGAGAKDDADLGRFVVTGRDEDRRRFRTPSLRQVADTGPYFHDGSAATLKDVIEHYDKGGAVVAGVTPEIAPLHLSPQEEADLEAFLRALSSPSVTVVRADAGPAGPSLVERARTEAAPRAVWIEAQERLEKSPADAEALHALLVAATRLGEGNLLDDAIERTRPTWAGDASLRRDGGIALVRRARLDTPPDPAILKDATATLAGEDGETGDPAAALELAYARHLLGETASAAVAYERALVAGDDATGERALAGIASLAGGNATPAYDARLEDLAKRHPTSAVVLRHRAADRMANEGFPAAIAMLEGAAPVVAASPLTRVMLAVFLREVERHADALGHERAALAAAPHDAEVTNEVEQLWRERRPLASFADCDALDRDFEALFAAAKGDASREMAWRNDLAFRLREIVSTYATRREGRTQALAEGAPADAKRLLARCVDLYEGAVAAIPKDAAERPFEFRWTCAAILNDAALMRHYWLDVRDLSKAEAWYLRAFELTDGAYMDTYHYNLQYLYGFELPGHEERWYGLARRAAERILKETPGGLVPDERKRDSARRDAEALGKLLEARRHDAPPK